MDRGEIVVSSIYFVLIGNKSQTGECQRIELLGERRGTAVNELLCFGPDNRIDEQSIFGMWNRVRTR